jgi:hypothetical protein
VADVRAPHPLGTTLQQHVGEIRRGRADVERDLAGHVNAEDIKRMRQFDAAASHPRMIRLPHGHGSGVRPPSCRLWWRARR